MRFEFESADSCDVSLFVNSVFNASGSVSNFYPFKNVSVTVGKFKKIKSYSGFIAELFVYFYPLTKREIEEHYRDGLREIQNGDGQFIMKELQKDESEHNK